MFLAKNQDSNGEYYKQYARYQELACCQSGDGTVREKYAVPGKRRSSFHLCSSNGNNRPLMTAATSRNFTGSARTGWINGSYGAGSTVSVVIRHQHPAPSPALCARPAPSLAAMNSQIESVTINGEFFLAEFIVITKARPSKTRKTTLRDDRCKPTVRHS